MFAVTCGHPEDVEFSTNMKTGVNVGDTVTFVCDMGYAILGQSFNTSTAMCQTDGNWTNDPTCVGMYIKMCLFSQ